MDRRICTPGAMGDNTAIHVMFVGIKPITKRTARPLNGANARNCENAEKRKLRRRKLMPVCRECGKNVNQLNYKGIPVCLQHYNELKKKDGGIWMVKTPKPVVPKAVTHV